jgi:GntR family transcriptional regulator, rspAB operon transcriptional repressor
MAKYSFDIAARVGNNCYLLLGGILAHTVTRFKRSSVLQHSFFPTSRPGLSNSAPATLSEKVYAAFKRDIVHGVFQPGESLSEKDLAKRYKASRTPVREAAVRLQNDRLLRIVPNRGYFVAQITLQVLNDIYEFRSAVECASAELAALKGATPEALQELGNLAQASCRPEDRGSCVRFIEADTAFHLGIALLTRNQMLFQAVNEARSQMERIMLAAIDIHYFGEVPKREHLDILAAIKDREPDRARQCMHDHIMQSKDKVLGIASVLPVRAR